MIFFKNKIEQFVKIHNIPTKGTALRVIGQKFVSLKSQNGLVNLKIPSFGDRR